MGLRFYIYIQGLAQQPEVHLQRGDHGREKENEEESSCQVAKREYFEIRPHIHQNRAAILHQSGYSSTGICGSVIWVTGLCVETFFNCRYAWCQKVILPPSIIHKPKCLLKLVLTKWLKESVLRLGPPFIKIRQQFSTSVYIPSQQYVDQLPELQVCVLELILIVDMPSA